MVMADVQLAVRNTKRHTQFLVHISNINIRDRDAFDKLRYIFRRSNSTTRNRDRRIVVCPGQAYSNRRSCIGIRRAVRALPLKARVTRIIIRRIKRQRIKSCLLNLLIYRHRGAIKLQNAVRRIRQRRNLNLS